MINLYHFTDTTIKVGHKITLESHQISHGNSKLIINPNFPEFGIDFSYINKLLDEMANIYIRLINQHKFNYQTVFSARFDKQDEGDLVSDKIDSFIILNTNHKITEPDCDKIDVKSALERFFQNQAKKDSGWRFDKIKSIIVCFYKAGGLIGSFYIKITLGAPAILNSESTDRYCFFWFILAHLHPCENSHPTRIKYYRRIFNELNSQSFDFIYGFKCSDVHTFDKLNNLSINADEVGFYRDQT